MSTTAKPTTDTKTIPVTVENFTRAETDMYFRSFTQGKIEVLLHHREAANATNQRVVRDNPNVVGSIGVFDLDAGPVTITMPDSGQRPILFLNVYFGLMTITESGWPFPSSSVAGLVGSFRPIPSTR